MPANTVCSFAAQPVPVEVSSVGMLLDAPMVVAPLLPVSQYGSPPSAQGHQILPSSHHESRLSLGTWGAEPVVNVSTAPYSVPEYARAS